MRRTVRIALLSAAGFTAAAVVIPLLIPVPPLEGTVPPEQLADPDSRFVDVDRIRVHFKTAGQSGTGSAGGSDGPVFLLLHGFAASTFTWRQVMAPLARYGPVVAYDRPGFGLTSRPMPGEWKGESPYGAEGQAEMAVAMMDALDISRAVVVGNSAGGTIAALVALAHPERVQALVLVDAAIYVHTGFVPSLAQPLLATPQMRRVGPLLARSISKWGIDFGKSAWHVPARITPEVWAGYLKPLQADNWDRGLWEFAVASRPLDLENRLSEMRMPVLVITGDDDRIIPTAQSARLARELPNAMLVVIPESGHVPQEESPAAFMEAVSAFVSKLE